MRRKEVLSNKKENFSLDSHVILMYNYYINQKGKVKWKRL